MIVYYYTTKKYIKILLVMCGFIMRQQQADSILDLWFLKINQYTYIILDKSNSDDETNSTHFPLLHLNVQNSKVKKKLFLWGSEDIINISNISITCEYCRALLVEQVIYHTINKAIEGFASTLYIILKLTVPV